MKNRLLFLCLLSIQVQLSAQHDGARRELFSFQGNSNIGAYLSDRQGYASELPSRYLTWHLNSNIQLLGIPFTSALLLSTLQSDAYQSMNHVSFKLDTKRLAMVKPGIPGFAFLKHFETLEVGRTRPVYSPLMLNGIMLNGINAGVGFRGFHLAMAYGQTQRPVSEGIFYQPQFQQRMAFGTVGVGRKEGTHFRLSALHSRDQEGSAVPASSWYIQRPDTFIHLADTFFIPYDSIPLSRKPGESLLAGVGAGVAMFRDKLKVQGEVTGSLRTTNTESEALDMASLPSWVNHIYQPRLTTSASYAFRVMTELNLNRSRLRASVSQVGPGYHSPGTPFLRQDLLSIDLSGNRSFLSRKLMVNGYMKTMHDNLSGMKPFTTQTLIWGFNALWRPLKLPYLHVGFTPHRQQMAYEGGQNLHRAVITIVSTGYGYKVRQGFTATSSVTWSNQSMHASQQGLNRTFTGNHFTFQQSCMLRVPLTVTGVAGYYLLDDGERLLHSQQWALRLHYRFSGKTNAGAGVRYIRQELQGSRTGITGSFNHDFGKYGALRFTAEPVIFQDPLHPERAYHDYIVRISFINTFQYHHSK